MITEEQARKTAADEAAHAYRDLSVYNVSARLEDGRWHIDYALKDPRRVGGGPHFTIAADTGEIIARRYEQ